MSVKQIEPGKYKVTLWWTENGRRRKRELTVCGSSRDAKRFERDLKNEMRAGNLVAQKEEQRPIPTLRDFSDEWFQAYVVPNNKPSEQDNKRITLDKHLLPYFGHLTLDNIDTYGIEQFKAQQNRKGYAPASINLHLGCLRKCLQCAMEWGLIEINPAMTVKKVKNDAEKWTFLDFDEAEVFLAAASDKWRPALVVTMDTGLRRGEVLALRWRDIDWTNRLVNVRHTLYKGTLQTPKSKGSRRSIPMTERVFETLTALRRTPAALEAEYVFSSETGTPLDPGNLRRALTATLKRAKMRKIRYHDIRHTFASHLAMAGVPIRTIQELMGHQTMDMTLKYAHLTEGHQREAMDKLQHQLQRFRNTQGCSTKSSSRISHIPAHSGNGGNEADK
jgi:integrase